MVALPGATPVTKPSLFTVATNRLSELQVTVLLVAFDGITVAVSCSVEFSEMLAELGLMLIPVTGIMTVISLVVVLAPSSVVALMVASPGATPVTSPVLFTVATEVLLELQITVLFVALDGKTVTVS